MIVQCRLGLHIDRTQLIIRHLHWDVSQSAQEDFLIESWGFHLQNKVTTLSQFRTIGFGTLKPVFACLMMRTL
jgi:hypothetical protein